MTNCARRVNLNIVYTPTDRRWGATTDQTTKNINNPIILSKMCFFLSVAEDLANRWTYLVLLYNVAFHWSWEGLKLFTDRVPPTSHEKTPLEKVPNPIF